MKKETYVVCWGCAWQLENYPERDWVNEPCTKCNNARKVRNPEEILCNLCGECMSPSGSAFTQDQYGLHDAVVSAGYFSKDLLDGHEYKFSICEACLRRMFMASKIKPQIIDYMTGNEVTWEEDQTYYEYREWRRNGGFHQAYLDKKCNMIKNCSNKAKYTELISDEFTENCSCEEHKSKSVSINAKLVPFIPNVLKPFL